MSAFLWSVLGGGVGLVAGMVVGFTAALGWASARPNPYDGTFAMREMLVCVPFGALVGLVAGIWWGVGR